MFIFDLQLFGGGGKKSKVSSIDAKLPTATAEEKELLKGQIGWINGTNQSANTLQGMGDTALGNVITPAYKDMFNQYLGTNQNNQNALNNQNLQNSQNGQNNITVQNNGRRKKRRKR